MGNLHWALALLGTLLVVAVTPVEGCGRGAVYIQNNEYRQVLIAIGEDVPEDLRLIDRIKEVFTATSQKLYQATRMRAYLSEIKILLPKTWSSRPEYEVPGNEAIDKSDIVIDKPDSRFNQGDRPFVIKTTPCGELGHYMHITPGYLLNDKVSQPFGPPAKVLLHEWAHLRYGVFDEYPTGTDPHFYNGPNGQVEATRCCLSLTGSQYDKVSNANSCQARGNLPDENCRFRDNYGEQFNGGYASLMYRVALEHVEEFCDNDKRFPKLLHNPDAPNQQNRKCGGRSVWEVLRAHGDFERDNNPPREINDTAPTFTLLRAQQKRYVLVLDISGSMGQVPSRLRNLGSGCSNFIQNIVRDGEMVGIVWFSTRAVRAAELTIINNQTRRELLDGIPIAANGWTSIGAGILEAIEVLKHNGGRPGGVARGGNLILVSDGVENRSPTILQVYERVMREKVTIHSIAFTNNADSNVDKLAKETGGLSFLYSDFANSNALNEAFRAIAELNQNIKDRKHPISSTAEEVDGGVTISRQVAIDSTLGRNTEFLFDYGGSDITISLVSPKGEVYTKSSPIVERDSQFGIYKFKFTGLGEVGRWTYNVTNTDLLEQKLAVTVVSQTAVEGQYPIMAQAYWGKRNLDMANNINRQSLYASVSQGYSAVLNAEVKAVVERPDGSTVNQPLLDNGAGADQTANDGIYSAYFVDFLNDGRYNVKVMVNSKAATVISSIRVVGRGAPPADITTYSEPDVRVTDLQRSASGGSFQLQNIASLPSGKIYAPSQVSDLKVHSVDLSQRKVRLTWTAPGAELDKGTVSSYELRYGTDFERMRENFTQATEVQTDMVMSGNLSSPSPPGHTETLELRMPATGDITYVFRLVSVDSNGRQARSEPSNLASAGMKAYVSQSGGNKTGVIVGSIFGTLAFLAIVAVVVIAVWTFSKQQRKDTASTAESGAKPGGGSANQGFS